MGVTPIPRVFVKIPGHFWHAKFILRYQSMFYKGGRWYLINLYTLSSFKGTHPLSPWSNVKIEYIIIREFFPRGGSPIPGTLWFLAVHRQLNRWPCHWSLITHSVSHFWFLTLKSKRESLETFLTYLPDLPTWPTYRTYLPDLPTWPTYLT